MFARLATLDDRDQLMGLARLHMAEKSGSVAFDENMARYTFGGIARADPSVHVLQDGDEIVGFTLIYIRTMPFAGSAQTLHQELLFVRADKRSAEAAAKLHDLMHGAAAFQKPAEVHVRVLASPDADKVVEHLCSRGYQQTGTCMSFTGTVDLAALRLVPDPSTTSDRSRKGMH